jgi:uncharacterized protein (DUF1697 family)
MGRLIALFRGINVGGKNVVAMKDLTRVMQTLGCTDVTTYIQSGNVVFNAGDTVTPEHIQQALQADLGIEASVQLLTEDDLRGAIDRCPFDGADAKTQHYFFLESAPADPDLDAIEHAAKDSERWALIEKTFYLHAPDGIGRSKLAASAEKLVGVGATARNGRTVDKLLDMVNA